MAGYIILLQQPAMANLTQRSRPSATTEMRVILIACSVMDGQFVSVVHLLELE